MKTSIREQFAAKFGEDQAAAIEAAANEHGNGINNTNLGSDPFKWALLICIGYECASKDSYRDHHGITAPWNTVSRWIKDHAELGTHNGDVDYLSMFAGAYNEFMPENQKAEMG